MLKSRYKNQSIVVLKKSSIDLQPTKNLAKTTTGFSDFSLTLNGEIPKIVESTDCQYCKRSNEACICDEPDYEWG